MIVLFVIAYAGHLLMLFTGFLRSAYFHSGIPSGYQSAYERKISKMRLKKHWRITWLLFGLAVYAGLSLY